MKTFTRTGVGCQYEMYFDVNFVAGKFVFDEGNKVYILNPLSFLPTFTYIEGELTDENTIVVNFPQKLFYEEYEGEGYNYYLNKMDFIFDNVEEQTGWYFITESDNTLTYKLIDGEWMLQGTDDGLSVLGLTNDNDEWMGYADFLTVFTPFNDTPLSLPPTLKSEKWAMTYEGVNGKFVDICFDGEDVYLGAFSIYFPDSYIKGEVRGDKIAFPTRQYLGIDRFVYHHDYLMGGEYHEEFDEYGYPYPVINLADEIVFNYDAEARTMSTEDAVIINSNPEYQSYFEGFTAPTIKWQPATTDKPTPQDPQILAYYPYDPMLEFAIIEFIVNPITAEGYLLDTNNLFYRIYLDDDIFEFTTDVYLGLKEDTELIPYGYTDDLSWTIVANGSDQGVYLFPEGYDRVGVQAVYFQEGEMYESQIIYADDDTNGVNVSVSESEEIAPVYYDISGRIATSDSKGMIIKCRRWADGSVKMEKTVR